MRNQYAARVTPMEFVNDFLANRVAEEWSVHHVFECLKPMGPGVDKMTTGYYRTNYQGKKKTVHNDEAFGYLKRVISDSLSPYQF
ncbi:hypothetical protein MMPV_010183 [Pyropia vietnamensis]